MMKKSALRLYLLLVVLCSFSSCEYHEEGPDETTLLLSENLWEDYFIMDDGAECRQTFQFHLDQTGTETKEYMFDGHPDGYETFTFRWEWDIDFPYCLIMNYGGGKFSYFDDISVTHNLLTGVLDDYDVTFNAARLKSSTQKPLKTRKLRERK